MLNLRRYLKYLAESVRIVRTFRNFPYVIGMNYLGEIRGRDPLGDCTAVTWGGTRFNLRGRNLYVGRVVVEDIWTSNIYRISSEDFVDRRPVFLDIGAHIGAFSLLVAGKSKEAQVYGFEPDPGNFAVLDNNIEINGLERRVHLFMAAVSSVGGDARLFLSEKSSTRNSLFRDEFLATRGKAVKVRSTTLEEIFRVNKIKKCAVLKLDCEGAEFEIILNAPSLILNNIRRIVMEYHDGISSYSHEDLVRFLKRQGFVVEIFPGVPNFGVLDAKNYAQE